jgi:hypothetical protein
MGSGSVVPDHEDLRRAVRWLGEQGRCTPALVEEASQRFDLSPVDEEFLLRHFCLPSGAADEDKK